MTLYLPPSYTHLFSHAEAGPVLAVITKANLEAILKQRKFILDSGAAPRDVAYAARRIVVEGLCVDALDLRGVALGCVAAAKPNDRLSGFVGPRLYHMQLDEMSELFNIKFLDGQIANFTINQSYVSEILFENMHLSDGVVLSPKGLEKTIFKYSRLENIICHDVEWAYATFHKTELSGMQFFSGLVYKAQFTDQSVLEGRAHKTEFTDCDFKATAINLAPVQCIFESCTFKDVDMMLNASLLTSKFMQTSVSNIQFWADAETPVKGIKIDPSTGYLVPYTPSPKKMQLRQKFGDMSWRGVGPYKGAVRPALFASLYHDLASTAFRQGVLPQDHPLYEGLSNGRPRGRTGAPPESRP